MDAVARFQSAADREGSFKYLYLAFFPKIERFFSRKKLSPQDCLDLTQETFLEVYKGLDGYRGEARFESWLYRVATTLYLKRLRSKATAKRSGHEISHDETGVREPALGSPGGQLDDMLDDERRQVMRDAIRCLPEQMRKCLTLRLFHDLRYREIATVMKLQIGTVKVHLFKARQRLQEDLRIYSLEDLDF